MAILVPTVQLMSSDGITPTFGAANADGYAIPGDGRTVVEVKNTNGAGITVTIDIPGTVDGLAVTDKPVAVALTVGDKIIGPFKPSVYNQVTGTWAGYALVTFSAVADVTVAFLRMP
jgi:hypothetical protein